MQCSRAQRIVIKAGAPLHYSRPSCHTSYHYSTQDHMVMHQERHGNYWPVLPQHGRHQWHETDSRHPHHALLTCARCSQHPLNSAPMPASRLTKLTNVRLEAPFSCGSPFTWPLCCPHQTVDGADRECKALAHNVAMTTPGQSVCTQARPGGARPATQVGNLQQQAAGGVLP
jgi:hypothetical protein